MNEQTAVVSRPAQGQAVATQSSNPLVQFREELEQRSSELKMALPSHISPEKFQRTVITAIQQNPSLLECSRRSLILACMKAAQDGLLPDGREAALVEFKNNKKVNGQWQQLREVAYIPMVHGVRKKILQARDANGKPVVSALYTSVVYRKEVEAGHFYYDLTKEPILGHRPMLDLTTEETKDDLVVGAYSIATMADGTRSYKFLRRFEIDKIRETSQTGAVNRVVKYGADRGKKIEPKGPWVDWFPQMCEKTVLKAHADSLPQAGDLILDAYDQDFDAAASTTLVLGAGEEDEPTLIEHDPETGEIIDAEADPSDASEDESVTAEQSGDEEAERQPEQAESTTESAETSTSEEDELAAEQRMAHEKMADQLIADIKATKSARVARETYLGCELERAALPEDLSAEVDQQYERHLASFKPAAPRQHQTASA